MTICYLSYSGLNRQLDRLHHIVSQFSPRKVMRSLVAAHFLAGTSEVVDAPLNRTASCQCMCALIIATFSAFFPLKVILGWEKYKDSSSTLKDDSLSELYVQSVQPSQCHCTPGSAVPFATFQSLLSSSPCAFLSRQGAQHTLPQAFRGQCIYLKTY